MTEQESSEQGKKKHQVSCRIDWETHKFLRDVFKHLNPEGEILSDYKFYTKLLEILKIRLQGDFGSASTFGAIVNYVREEAQAIGSAQAQPSDNSFLPSDSSLTTSLDFDILSQCPHYQGHNDQVCFCKSRSKQLSRFKGKIPHSVCNVHWLRHQKAWESLSPEEKQHKQRQMEEQRFKRRDYTSSQPYYDG